MVYSTLSVEKHMRKRIREVRDIQTQIYKNRVDRGQYLSDIPLRDLCMEERISVAKDTQDILYKTGLELRKVIRQKKLVWRFVDKL